jgi:hypothetical protein
MQFETPSTHSHGPMFHTQRSSAALPAVRRRARADTNPEVPAAKRPSVPPQTPASTRPQPSPPDDGRYEVWTVRGLSRKRQRSFGRLRDAMRFISSQGTGSRYDILMPNGKWFSKRDTIRRLRRASRSETTDRTPPTGQRER